MNLESKIFDEIRHQKIGANGIWRFQQYWGTFAINKLDAEEQKEFSGTMENLCGQNIFIAEPYTEDIVNYRLTDYGADIVYR